MLLGLRSEALKCIELLNKNQYRVFEQGMPNYSDFIKAIKARIVTHEPIRLDELIHDKEYNFRSELNFYFQKLLSFDLKTGETNINDSFSILFSIKKDLKLNQPLYYYKIIEMIDIFYFSRNVSQILDKIDNWIETPQQALLIYDVLFETRLIEKLPQITEKLFKNNSFFSKNNILRHDELISFVTYSFERESPSKNITDYFRLSHITEVEWFKLSLDKRYQLMKKYLSTGYYNKSDVHKIVPTLKTPSFLRRPFLEYGGNKDGTWEVNNKLYEFSIDEIIKQIEKTNKIADNTTDSVHLHIVFSMKKTYTYFNKFREWFKAISDYIFIRGLEEGLHPSKFTDLPFLNKKSSSFNQPAIVERLSDLKQMINKYFTVGLRSEDIYKGNVNSEYQKIGLELRDTTRDMQNLSIYAKNLTRQIQKQIWESKALDVDFKVKPFRIELDREMDLLILSKYINPEIAELMYRQYPYIILPFRMFENEFYYNYNKDLLMGPTNFQKERIIQARDKFIIELKNVERDIIDHETRNEDLSEEIIEIALKWNVTDWAKQAKISDLMNPF